MEESKWIYCPVCQSKTRIKVRKETEMKFFPLFCPKCKQETIIHIKEGKVSVVSNTGQII